MKDTTIYVIILIVALVLTTLISYIMPKPSCSTFDARTRDDYTVRCADYIEQQRTPILEVPDVPTEPEVPSAHAIEVNACIDRVLSNRRQMVEEFNHRMEEMDGRVESECFNR